MGTTIALSDWLQDVCRVWPLQSTKQIQPLG
jgi:hypothetical protein